MLRGKNKTSNQWLIQAHPARGVSPLRDLLTQKKKSAKIKVVTVFLKKKSKREMGCAPAPMSRTRWIPSEQDKINSSYARKEQEWRECLRYRVNGRRMLIPCLYRALRRIQLAPFRVLKQKKTERTKKNLQHAHRRRRQVRERILPRGGQQLGLALDSGLTKSIVVSNFDGYHRVLRHETRNVQGHAVAQARLPDVTGKPCRAAAPRLSIGDVKNQQPGGFISFSVMSTASTKDSWPAKRTWLSRGAGTPRMATRTAQARLSVEISFWSMQFLFLHSAPLVESSASSLFPQQILQILRKVLRHGLLQKDKATSKTKTPAAASSRGLDLVLTRWVSTTSYTPRWRPRLR